jgi:RecA-family ATPase
MSFNDSHKKIARGWHRQINELKEPYFKRLTAKEARIYGENRPAIAICYHHLDGTAMCRPDGQQIIRVRFHQDDPDTKRYSGRAGDPVALYFPKGLRKLLRSDQPIHAVEGENKADYLVRLGVPAFGYQGISAWQGKGVPALGFEELAPYIQGQPVTLDLDSDVTQMTAKKAVSRKWVKKLGEYIATLNPTRVLFRPLPTLALNLQNLAKSKTGVDDFLAANGDDLSKLFELGTIPLGDARLKDWDSDQGGLPDVLRNLQPVDMDWIDQQPEPVKFIVNGLLAMSEVGAIAGRGGAGKTTWALEVAVGAAIGRSVLGLVIPKSRRVLYCMLERHKKSLIRRVHRVGNKVLRDITSSEELKQARKLLAQNLFPLPLAGEHLGLAVKDGRDWKMNIDRLNELAEIMTANRIAAVFIDTVSRLHGGSGIDDALANVIVQGLERLCQMTGAAILFLAHVGKSGRGDLYGIFGSSIWTDNTSNMILMSVMPTSELNGYTITSEKRDAPEIDIHRDVIVKLEQQRASDYGEYPEQNYVIYRDKDNGGEMRPVLLKRSSQDSDIAIMEFVRDHYEKSGKSYTKNSFWKARLAGKNCGRPAHEIVFDRLVGAGQLLPDGESDGAFSRYVPLSVPDANEDKPQRKKRRKHGK